MHYKVVESTDTQLMPDERLREFERFVNNNILAGFVFCSPLIIKLDSCNRTLYFQPMTSGDMPSD